MLSLSVHHIIFVECFHLCIVLQVFIRVFLIRDTRMLQVFFYHHQIYFLFLLLNLIFHLWLRNLIFHQDLHFLLAPQLPDLHHMSSSIKICFFLMTLFNTILPNQLTQYILVINILRDVILLFLFYLKFCLNLSGTLIHYIKQCNNFLKLLFDCFTTCVVFNTTCCTEMDGFSATSSCWS